MDSSRILTLKNLSAGYDSPLQKEFSLDVHRGEFLALIGPNGAGKSTLLKTILKELKPLSGTIFYDGKNLAEIPLKDFSKTTSALLTAGRYPHTGHFGRLSEDDLAAIEKAIRTVKAEDFCEKQFLHLSDGQKQRILFARALCQNPGLLVLDEPTSYLDIRWRLEMLKTIRELCKTGVTVIASLHEIDLALKNADRILCVGQGEISLLSGNFEESKNQIKNLYGLEESFFEEEKAYTALLKNRCEKPGILGVRGLAPVEGVADSLDEAKGETSPCKNSSIMIQGTMSNAGKSFVVAGLCRVFRQDGFSAAPFKSQNMALNSFVTEDGLEMGRAQVMQAEAAGVEPSVLMNPVLLKPNSDSGSQVIVNGEVLGDMSAREYFAFKKSLVPQIKSAYEKLASEHQIIVIEGAGSPAEINLKENDIVNMGMAKIADSPVILVADIDRGGVFAQLLGTIELLEEDEKKRVKGFIINKFRGDESILESGIRMIEKKTGIPCVGTLPYIRIQLDDEDSLSENLQIASRFQENSDRIQLAVVRLPHISNFTDFIPLQNHPAVNLYYVKEPKDLGSPDGIIIPGTKNTVADLEWLKKNGLAERIVEEAGKGTVITGICGGFQILGNKLEEEGEGSVSGLNLLPVETVFCEKKTRTRVCGKVLQAGISVSGYEIHQGQTRFIEGAEENYFSEITDSVTGETKMDGAVQGNVSGTYIHGLFDEKGFCEAYLEMLARKRNVDISKSMEDEKIPQSEEKHRTLRDFKESQYDLLAETVRSHIDMKKIYALIRRKGSSY